MAYLVQQKGAVTGHPSSVVHRCRDVAAEEVKAELRNNVGAPQTAFRLGRFSGGLETHSPLASSSQISKNTIRSYLLWQGPDWGRVMAVSLVAGTEQREEEEEDVKAEAGGPTAGGAALHSHTGRPRRLSGQEIRGGRGVERG